MKKKNFNVHKYCCCSWNYSNNYSFEWTYDIGKTNRQKFRFINKMEIISVEKMESDENPIVHDTDLQTVIYKNLIDEIKKTKMKRKRRELGMEIKKPLYTMTVSSDNDYITFTVNNEGEIQLKSNRI